MHSQTQLASAINFLTTETFSKTTPASPPPTHHYFLADVSGSMYSALPHIRKQLKNQLASLVKSNDTVSLIAFSGKNQCFVLFEHEPIATHKNLKNLHSIIDSSLQTIGLTGFKQPLDSALSLIQNRTQSGTSALFFLTDGYDNQWSTSEITASAKQLAAYVDASFIVEYGWYCNHDLLVQLSEILGAQLLFARNIDEYLEVFSNSFQANSNSSKKQIVQLSHTPSIPLGFVLNTDSILPIPLEQTPTGWTAAIPENASNLSYFTTSKTQNYTPYSAQSSSNTYPWAALATLSQTAYTPLVWDLLATLSDVHTINVFTNTFSKEDYIAFQQLCQQLTFNPQQRYLKGFDPKAVPDENAFTVLDMLSILANNNENLFYPLHPDFEYNRISAKTQTTESASNTHFTPIADSTTGPGVPIASFSWNETRPNLSILVNIPGTVNLPDAILNLDSNTPIPSDFPSHIWRNYTIIRDGIVHTRNIPVSLSFETFSALQQHNLLCDQIWAPNTVYWLNFPHLPVINRSQVKATSATTFLQSVLDLTVLKAQQKVYNNLASQFAPKSSTSFASTYSETVALALSQIGITDYNGYNPQATAVKGSDIYIGYELKTSVKGISSLPKVEDAQATLATPAKAKPAHLMMHPAIQRINEYLLTNPTPENLSTWARQQATTTTNQVRLLNQQLSQQKLILIVGHSWFSEFSSTPGSASLTLPSSLIPSISATVNAELKQIEIAI